MIRLSKRLSFVIAIVAIVAVVGLTLFAARGTLGALFAAMDGRASNTAASVQNDWTMEGANPARTRARTNGIALPIEQQRAIRITGDTGAGSPVAIAQNIALVESADFLRAIDLRNGQIRWSFEQKGSYISPAVAGKTVYVRAEAGNKGDLIALNLVTGEQQWSFTPRRVSSLDASYWGGHLSSPVIVDQTVFVGAGKEMYALDTATGEVRWEHSGEEYIASSPAVADGAVFISDAYGLYALDQQSGKRRWMIPTNFSVYFAPVVANNMVFFTDGTNVRAVNAADGTAVWTSTVKDESLLPGGVQGALLYVKSTTKLHALDLASSKEVWSYEDKNFISFPAIAANSLFAIVGSTGQTSVLVLDATTGDRVSQYRFPLLTTAAPIIAGQTLYVRTTDGKVLGLYN